MAIDLRVIAGLNANSYLSCKQPYQTDPMKLPLLITFLLISSKLYSQTTDTLLYERFETGGASFTLNSPDENGVSAAVGYNQWIINNA